MKKIIFLFFILGLGIKPLLAQSKLAVYEDSLQRLGTTFTNDTVELNRIQANYQFIKTLVSVLKEKNSFAYPFKNLSSFISIKKAEDNKFRIITWFIMNDDGSSRYYGAIQMNNPSKLELYPLVDNTQNLQRSTNLADTTLNPNQWYGAVYYHILPVTNLKKPYYILLGWKGENLETSSKVIETLYFENGKPKFGTPVLQSEPKINAFHDRIIFNYTKDASMLLSFAKDEGMIVFDHLVALNNAPIPSMNKVYAPDLSYDGLKFKSGKWIYLENLKLKNLPTEEDDLFIDPSKDSQNTSATMKE